MKKDALLFGIGAKDEEPSAEGEDLPEETTDTSDDSDTDEAIDTFMDASADDATRREAFRRAVKGCY